MNDTMGRILEHWRIPAATFFSLALIVGAYVLARDAKSPTLAQASEESALLQAIAKKDSDNDGLPDWEESLYGTSPNDRDSRDLGMTDGEAVAKGLIVPKAITDITIATSTSDSVSSLDDELPPAPAEGTLTAAFAKNFFSLYIAAKTAKNGANLSEEDLENISSQALNALSTSITTASDFKTLKNLIVSGSGAEAMKMFAANAETVLTKNTSNATTSEITYLKYAIESNDTEAFTHIASIAKAYRESAAGLAMLPVPEELAADHLLLVNALMRTSQIISDFTRANSDPLAAILALKQYPQATQALGTAFIHIGNLYVQAGIFLPAGVPGAAFVNLITEVMTSQQMSGKKP